MNHRHLTAAAFAAALTFAAAGASADVVYDIGDNVGPAGTAMSADGWYGDDLANWLVAGFTTDLYARNTNDGDNTIYRFNDDEFSYFIPDNARRLTIEVIARAIGNANGHFFQVGLANGTDEAIGLGGDFNNDNKVFILDDFARIKESGVSLSGDSLVTLLLDIDLIALTADLSYNGTTVIDDAALAQTTFAEIAAADSLFIRGVSRFSGPARFTIGVTVPTPAALPAGLGALGLIALRRPRRAA